MEAPPQAAAEQLTTRPVARASAGDRDNHPAEQGHTGQDPRETDQRHGQQIAAGVGRPTWRPVGDRRDIPTGALGPHRMNWFEPLLNVCCRHCLRPFAPGHRHSVIHGHIGRRSTMVSREMSSPSGHQAHHATDHATRYEAPPRPQAAKASAVRCFSASVSSSSGRLTRPPACPSSSCQYF